MLLVTETTFYLEKISPVGPGHVTGATIRVADPSEGSGRHKHLPHLRFARSKSVGFRGWRPPFLGWRPGRVAKTAPDQWEQWDAGCSLFAAP